MKVLSVAFPLAAVGPDTAGGAEQVLAALDRHLVAAGHRSVVVACARSRCAGELLEIPAPPDPIDDLARHRAHAAVRAATAELLRRERFDVVHLHGLDFADYLPPAGPQRPPVLVTLHLPPAWYPADALAPRPGVTLCCVSAAQRATLPAGAAAAELVPNGVDLDALRPLAASDGGACGAYALVLGRICPEKGVHLALDAARAAGVPLVVAGCVFPYPEHRRYFAEEVAPRLDGERRFVGAVGGEAKRRLLAGARVLLVPSLAPETSSLVAMEALACGTPVVALASGALPEIVEPGRTGVLVEHPADLPAALRRAATLSRRDCRRAAEERFSSAGMAAGYLALYRRLAAGGSEPDTGRRAAGA